MERTYERGWEVTLDPERRVPTAVVPFAAEKLGLTGTPRACAYDENDRLAIIGGMGLVVGGDPRIDHTLGGGVKGLLRAGAQWLALGAPGGAQCLRDDGTRGNRADVAALTTLPFLPDHVAWIAPGSRARPLAGAVTAVVTIDPFCDGSTAVESLEEPEGIDLWDDLQQVYVHVTYRRSDVVDASLVARPDGSLLVAGWNRRKEAGRPATELWDPEFTDFFEPAWRPCDPARRLPTRPGPRRAAGRRVARATPTAAWAAAAGPSVAARRARRGSRWCSCSSRGLRARGQPRRW